MIELLVYKEEGKGWVNALKEDLKCIEVDNWRKFGINGKSMAVEILKLA